MEAVAAIAFVAWFLWQARKVDTAFDEQARAVKGLQYRVAELERRLQER